MFTREQLETFRDKNVHIIGASSAEGVAVLRLLVRLGFSKLTVHDMRERLELRRSFRTVHGAFSREEQEEIWSELRPIFDAGNFGSEYLTSLEDAELVVLGQGWYLDPENRKNITDKLSPSAQVTSMTELYFMLHRGPIAAITGTNGKSTTAALVDHLLTNAGVEHLTSGNERSNRQFLPDIDDVVPGTWALLEVSNRQLLQIERSPQVAAITSLTPDHLEEHGGWDGYRSAKAKLFLWQSSKDVAIVNADDKEALRVANSSPVAEGGRLIRCGVEQHKAPCVTWREGVLIAEDVPLARGERVREGQFVIATEADMRMPGVHNLQNAAVAVAVALASGADPSTMAESLRTFAGKSLRLEKLDSLNGIDVWSDLKSTTPESTLAAISALDGAQRIILIVGGDNKGLDYTTLGAKLQAGNIHTLAVPGSATDALEQAVNEYPESGTEASFERVEALDSALTRAFELAVSGDVVIVSPAAAGFWTRELQGKPSLRKLVKQHAQEIQETVK